MGETVDKKHNFDCHIVSIFLKAHQKLSGLGRLIKNDYFSKHFLTLSPNIVPSSGCFVEENQIIELINFMIHRSLIYLKRVVHSVYTTQTFLIEIIKVKHNISGNVFKDLLTNINTIYSFTANPIIVSLVFDNTGFYGENSISYFETLLWNKVPSEITNINHLNRFKAAIRKLKPSDCPCRLCKNYLGNVGYINGSNRFYS